MNKGGCVGFFVGLAVATTSVTVYWTQGGNDALREELKSQYPNIEAGVLAGAISCISSIVIGLGIPFAGMAAGIFCQRRQQRSDYENMLSSSAAL